MSATLRFGVGDRVRCKTGPTKWKKGRIKQLHYREDNWPPGRVAPYQVELENSVLIYAPADTDQLIQAEENFVDSLETVEIHVCQAGPCRRAGGEAVLLEIEELASTVSGIEVQASGCLGNCNQAPNAMLVKEDTEDIFARLCDLPAAAAVVEKASGRAPNLDDEAMVARLARARRLRVRTQSREESKWNLALAGMAEDVQRAADDDDERAELVQEYAELLGAAGRHEQALGVLSDDREVSLQDIPALRLLLQRAELLALLGRAAEWEWPSLRRRSSPPRPLPLAAGL